MPLAAPTSPVPIATGPTSSSSALGRGSRCLLLPGERWPRRTDAGEVQLPAGKGLRRRADAAGGQGADRHGRADCRERRVATQQGPADHRWWRPDRARLARAVQLSRLRPGPDPDGLRPDPGPARAEGWRPAARGRQRHRSGARRQDRPDHRRDHQETATLSLGPLVVAADGNSSRLSVAMGLHKRDDRPLGVAVRTYYTSPRHDDDYLEAWLDLWDGSPAAARLRLDLRDGRRDLQRRSRAAEHLDRLRRDRLPGPAAQVAGRDAGRVGLHRGEPDAADPRCGPADGLQPDPALHQGPAAGRRCRRDGQPVQRRGHRLCAGVRRDWRRE